MNGSDNPFPPGSKIVAYLRDSGGDDQDLSVAQQEIHARGWAASHGLILIRTFRDEARTGSSDVSRDGFLEMIAHFRGGAEETGIIIWKWSRFARSVDDSQFYRADLRRRGYIIHSLQDVVPDGPNGRFFEAAIDWMNEKYLEDLSDDVRRGLQHIVREYGALGGRAPTGFRRVPVNLGTRRDGTPHILHRWEYDPATIDAVRTAWAMRANGATYKQLAEATGLFNNTNSWESFFKNRIYLGELRFGEIFIANYCEPLIDLDTWKAVREVSAARSHPRSDLDHPRRVNSRGLLSGLLRCQECGGTMIINRISKNDYYLCSHRTHGFTCTARRIPLALMDRSIIDIAREHILDIENLLAVQAKIHEYIVHEQERQQHQRIELTRRLATVTGQVSRLTEAIAEHGHSPALLQKLASLETETTDLHRKIGELAAVPSAPARDRQSMTALAEEVIRQLEDPATRQRIIRAIFTRIVAKRNDDKIIGIAYYTPSTLIGLQVEKLGGQLGVRAGSGHAKQTEHLIHLSIPTRKYKLKTL